MSLIHPQDVPDLHLVAGNPARIIKRIPPPDRAVTEISRHISAENPMAELAKDLETKSKSPNE